MADSKLGTKQLCPACEVKFYDLNKRPATCPNCGASFEPDEEDVQSIREKVKAKAPVPTSTGDDDAEDEDTAEATDEDEAEEETVAELGTEDESIIVTDANDDEDDGGKTVPAGFTEQGVDDDAGLDDDDDEFDLDVDAALEEADGLIANEAESK